MDEQKNFVMVTVSGPDQPGITASFSKILVDNQVEIVDIEQASLQDFLGLSFLLDMSGAKQSKDGVLKDLLFEASRHGLTLNFRLYSENEVKARNSKNLFVLTYFGDTRALAEITNILGDENANIQMITNLTRHCASCVELTIDVNKVRRGDLDFEDGLIQRVAFLKGLGIQELEKIRDEIRLSEGAEELVMTLKRLGYKFGLVSGGVVSFSGFLSGGGGVGSV